jgi:hypothetical protein
MEWCLADAKNRFSELVNKALLIGPQIVRRRDDTVVVLSERDCRRLQGHGVGFKQHFLNPPSGIEDLSLERDKSSMRNFEL